MAFNKSDFERADFLVVVGIHEVLYVRGELAVAQIRLS